MVIPQPISTNNSFISAAFPNVEHAKSLQQKVGKYTLSKTLGKGSTGKVKLAIHTETNKKMAVKIVSRKIIRNDSNESEEKRRKEAATEMRREIRTVREASIMLLLDHPFIVRVEEMMLVDDFYYIFMEYVDGGQLLDYVISHGKLKEKQARNFSRQIASALDYCHRNSIVHRDLKVENILISRTGNIKIIDFGLSNLFSPTSHLSTFCGSLYFAAPELLHGRIYTGPEVDVWSFGVVIYVLMCGQVPFDDPTVYGLHKKVKQGLVDYPFHLSSDAKDLMNRMLVIDPKKRASMSEVIVHPWMMKGFELPVENYLPKRKPLQLPINLDVVHDMTGFEFGTEDAIIEELEFLICSREYQIAAENINRLADPIQHHLLKRTSFPSSVDDPLSLPAAYHPLISIYYLVKERLERNQLKPTEAIRRDTRSKSVPDIQYSRNVYNTPPKPNVFRRMSRRWSGNHDGFTPTVENLPQHTSSLSKKLNRMLKRGATVNVKDLPSSKHSSSEEYRPLKRNSVSCKLQTKGEDHADDLIRPVYLKGLFSVSTTSTKKGSTIRCEIMRTLDKHRDIKFRELRDRFQCCLSIGTTGDADFDHSDEEIVGNPSRILFDIYIVKIPWLLGMRGVQFRRISGDPWIYKNICSRVLGELSL